MSFAKDVKQELANDMVHVRHCRLAEIAGMVSFGARVIIDENTARCIEFTTDNEQIARKYFTYVEKTFNIELLIKICDSMGKNNKRSFIIRTASENQTEDILSALKATDCDGIISVGGLIYQQQCCKRAFLRGAFLIIGGMSDPKKAYYFEYAAACMKQADVLKKLIAAFSIETRIIKRKNSYIVYLKESSQIVDMLNIIEAHVALMELENVRILKEVRNGVNRRVNCEAANIGKTVAAASKQVEDIEFIRDTIGLDELVGGLKDIALLRLEYPESSLVELGEKLVPAVGKSGVNHRLKKISSIADSLRGLKEDKKC